MNRDQVKGKAKEVAGATQKNVGKLVDSEEHQAKGSAREAEGKVQKTVGNAKEKVKSGIDKL